MSEEIGTMSKECSIKTLLMIGGFETNTGLTERVKSLGDILAGLCVNTVNKAVKKYLRSYNPKHTFKQQQTDLLSSNKSSKEAIVTRYTERANGGIWIGPCN